MFFCSDLPNLDTSTKSVSNWFFRSEHFSGYVECRFENTNRKIFTRLPILCHFSLSSNFSLQFIDVLPDFSGVVVIRNRRDSDNEGLGLKPSYCQTFFKRLSCFDQCSFFSTQVLVWFFELFAHFFQIPLFRTLAFHLFMFGKRKTKYSHKFQIFW